MTRRNLEFIGVRFGAALFLLCSLGAFYFAEAQDRRDAKFVNAGRVTIQTNGLFGADVSDSNTSAEIQMTTELVRELDEPGKIRVLPVLGYGQEENVRDLLLLRNVEFSIVNSDILAFLNSENRLPSVNEKVRYFIPLVEKTIAVVSQKKHNSLDDLDGEVIATPGPGSEAHITARTLFAALNLKPNIRAVPAGQALAHVARGEAAATVLLSHSKEDLFRVMKAHPNLTVLQVPHSEAVAKTYGADTLAIPIGPEQASRLNVQTVSVQSILAIFNWPRTSTRFLNVKNFIDRAINAFPTMRTKPESLWNRVDPDQKVLGWQRYQIAEAGLTRTKAERANRLSLLTKRSKPKRRVQPDGETGASPAPETAPNRIPNNLNVSLLDTGFLSTKSADDGGVITALLKEAFSSAKAQNKTDRQEMALNWVSKPLEQVRLLSHDDTHHLAAPWFKPNCEDTGNLSLPNAVACDRFLFSDSLLSLPHVLYATKASGIGKTGTPSSIFKGRICTTERAEISSLVRLAQKTGYAGNLNVVRRDTFTRCFAEVTDGRADLVFGAETEIKAALGRLGLVDQYIGLPFPVGVATLHAIVSKDHPSASQLLELINTAIASLHDNDRVKQRVNAYLLLDP